MSQSLRNWRGPCATGSKGRIPAWAGLEDELLRESWTRREKEQAKAQAKAAAKEAATDASNKAKAKAKAKEEEPKAEEEVVDLPPEVTNPP